ncbi:MAG: structural protein [Zetaproteobacteria bacterium]|nr:MAG: structural protein [Zetaproteobacteria bacterium]
MTSGGVWGRFLVRGSRNNNPGNLIDNGINWKGLDNPRNDGRYLRFVSPEWGIRALVKVLYAYYHKHGLRTVRAIITRYAPPTENDTEAYVQHVARELGVSPDAPLPWSRAIVEKLVRAIIKHENGINPYDVATIEKGIELAGVA